MPDDSVKKSESSEANTIELPSPTAWPIVLAFGITLVFAGMLTSASISLLGGFLTVFGCVGWFRDVLPHEKHEVVPVLEKLPQVVTNRQRVQHIEWVHVDLPRARLPLEIYPVSAGVKGGLVGGAMMAILAVLYGIISKSGVWYPINLLSAGFFLGRDSTAQIAQFHWDMFGVAIILHLLISFLVGLLYGATLPIFPRHPILLGGFVAPILWSGLLHSTLELINPVLKERIDWPWFVVSQIGFGITAGIVVLCQTRINTWQHLPLAMRVGMEMKFPNKNTEDGGAKSE